MARVTGLPGASPALDVDVAPLTEEELDRIDATMRRLVARVAPLRFDVARTPAEREAVFRLRYQAVIEQGWPLPAGLPPGLECDADDERALHVVAWDGATLAATARLVVPSPGRRLPTEALFDLVIEPQGRVVNVDRMTVAASHRDRRHRVFAALFGQSWIEARARGFHVAAGIHSPPMVRLCRLIGLNLTVLGPARRFWGEERYPVRFDGVRHAVLLGERFADSG